ncbi:Uncharacterised protein [Vibrio cholerae]|nr:Uncharacterised protein [Vibrio cholerae]CSC90955.1 Uncharacterised protein [Vibrio cholerae]
MPLESTHKVSKAKLGTTLSYTIRENIGAATANKLISSDAINTSR